MGVTVGIDLGTSNSCVAFVHDGTALVCLDADGNPTQPSVVAFGFGQQVVVGRRARRQLLHTPENTVMSVKRLIGGRFHSTDVQRLKAHAAYGIAEGPDDTVRVRVQGKMYTPEEISAHILAHMKRVAEYHIGEPITEAVITVPAYFNDSQRQATRDAAAIAGIECLRILNEPTAAALAYGYQKGRRQHIVVYDLGGGTFDVSVLRIDEDFFEVIGTAGDTFLGGDDFDELTADKFLKTLEQQVGASFEHNRLVRMRLRDAAERAKIGMTDAAEVEVVVPTAWRAPTGEEHQFQTSLNRYQYATWVMPLVRRTIEVCELALRNASLSTRQIDAVLLVGGMTRYPLIREAVQQFFGP
jgi:molecular chaperone DnaK